MIKVCFHGLFVLAFVFLNPAGCLKAQQDAARPITGKAVEKFAPFDPVIEKHMDHIGATAASFAVQLNGRIVYSRAYGWADKDRQVPATPQTTFRIASNTKPITAAIVRQLVTKKKELKLSTKVIPFLDIEPAGELGDERLKDITIEHLLGHKGGWDKKATFDPTYRPKAISKFHKIRVGELSKEHIVSYMLTKPLQYTPGEKYAYSNFGYMLLGLVVEKATGASYAEAVDEFSGKLKADLKMSATNLENRPDAEVYYPRESGLVMPLRDSLGGLASSSESMCKFMKRYWTTGKRRKKKDKFSYHHFGRHANSTNAIMEYRKDGVDYSLIFNSSRGKEYVKDIEGVRKAINDVIDQIKNSR